MNAEPEVQRQLAAAAAALKAAERVLVTGHENPDGDALGSLIAVGLLAEALGKEVVYFTTGPVPDVLTWLPRADRLVDTLPDGWRPDVTVLVDCASRARAGAGFPLEGWGETVICLDHHVTFDPNVADILVRDVSAAATGELALALVDLAGVPLSRAIAEAVYCAVLTDTGCFRYSSTRPETLESAARLLRAGVDPWHVASEVYESEPRERLALMQRVLETLYVSADGAFAAIVITEQMFRETGAHVTMSDGLINLARAVRGVEVAAQLTEIPDGKFRVGLRSKGRVDVSSVAAAFGGGGHRNAAGFTFSGALESLRESLEETLARELKES